MAFAANGEGRHIGSFAAIFQAATRCLSAWRPHPLHL